MDDDEGGGGGRGERRPGEVVVGVAKRCVGTCCVPTATAKQARHVHKMVVFPALSNPRIRIRTSLDPKRD